MDKTLLLLVTLQNEAKPIIRALALTELCLPQDKVLPVQAFQGKIHGIRTVLVTQGIDPHFGVESVGTEAAAITTFWALKTFHPDLIINAGTAGAFGAMGANIGDVYLSKGKAEFHDRRIPIPKYREYGIGSYPLLPVSKLSHALKLKEGIISTGSSLDMTPLDKTIIQARGALLKDMELAAIAYVANLFQVPLFAVKAVTDLLDSKVPTEEAFLQNFHLATEALQKAVVKVLRVSATHPVFDFLKDEFYAFYTQNDWSCG